ncbi:MAG: gluconolactonase [Planctomycetaceae bacterium]|nr:gluconolactonase [Planctomycetaceae bacterium]
MKTLMIRFLLCSFAAISFLTANLSASEIFEGKATKVLPKGAGEGPAWHPKLGLLFSGGGRINRLGLDGKLHEYRKPIHSNGNLFDYEGRLITCNPGQRRVIRTELDGTVKVLTDRYNGQPYNQPNDLTIDAKGRIYFSDPKYGPRENLDQKDEDGKVVEGVYRIDPDGKVTRVITHEADRPNGVLVSKDQKFLYVADNNNNTNGGSRKLFRFKLKKNGDVNPKSRKILYDWKNGRGPDGLVQDVEGRLYVAGGLNGKHPPFEDDSQTAGIYVFSAEGKLLEVVHIPNDEVTNCTFGGADLKTLYITAGGTLWSIRTKATGWLPWPKLD